MPRALEGLEALELCSMVAGPYATKLLAEFGAGVVKIEPPAAGDPARQRTGSWPQELNQPSSLFLYLDSDKRSITLSLTSAGGRRIFRRLVQDADVLVEDWPPGELESLGLGYEALRELNPGLIWASITPYGQTGPHRDYRAYPLNTFHAGGEGYLLPGGPGWERYGDRPPLQGAPYLGEYRCGLTAALGVLIALFWRQAGGSGQHLDVSKQEALVALSRIDLGRYLAFGKVESRATRAHPIGGLYPCRDGFVELHPVQEHEWRALVELMGNPPWSADQKFQDRGGREHHKGELDAHITAWTLQHGKEEVFHRAQTLGCPAGPVYTPAELLRVSHLQERGFFSTLEDAERGPLDYPGVPYRFTGMAAGPTRAAPALGEHNAEIYSQRLGYTPQELVRLRQAGVI